VEGAEMSRGMPVFERGTGSVVKKGRQVYLNLSPAGYLLKRSKGEAAEWLSLVKGLMAEAGIEARLTLNLPRTEAVFWKNGDRTTLCVVKNIDRRASIDDFGAVEEDAGQAASKLKLSFRQPVKGLKNERTGKILGDGKSFEDDFVPWEANVYTFTP
jgi:hypothetical protein